MVQATVEIIGLGFFEIETDLDEVKIARAKTVDGDPVNWQIAKVHRSTKAAKAALENRPFEVRAVNGFFMLDDGQEPEDE